MTSVDFAYNHIVRADFINHPKLTLIDLAHNQSVIRIDVSDASALRMLDVWQNKITEVSFDRNPLLYCLSIGENPLTLETKTYIRSLLQIKDLQIDP